jgi:subtilase family serine protease
MKNLKMGAVALASLLGVVGTSAPAAGPNGQPVERYGRVFAVSVCGHIQVALQARCFGKVVTDARGNIINGKPNLNRNATPSGLSPASLNLAYGLSPASGPPGSGPTIAIVDAYGYPNAEKDLATYRAQFGLGACTSSGSNPCFRKVNQNGATSYPRTDVGWDQEQALDLDMASAMCPSCKILLVQATTPSYGNLAAAVNRAAAMGAIVISNSYGGSESGSTSYERSYDHSGIAVTASTGDSGYGAQFPASSPHVVAVGGTHLTGSGNSWTETAWDGAGSGCSSVYGPLTSGGMSIQASSDTGCPNRALADVSAVADPNTGVAVYGPVTRSRSGWMVFGGTSVSAPLIGGVLAAVGGFGTYPAMKLYSSSATSFRDILTGNNGSCPVSQWCVARSGWDGPTGRGSPQGANAF